VTGSGKDLHEARANAYGTIELIDLENSFYRKDIALKAAGESK
jgi:phosphoribosylamine-glycine ligase